MRHRTPRRSKTLLALAIASLAVMASGCGSSDDDGAASSTTPFAATGTTATTTPAVTTAVTTPTKTTTTSKSTSGSVVTRGANGKMYHCVGPSLLSDVRTLSRRIDRGRRSLKRIRSELRRLKKRYPGGVAPPRVAQRYNYLVRKHNALLRLGNRRVSAYNRRLERDCSRG